MALVSNSLFSYFRFELKNGTNMNKSEFYSEFLFRYQTEGAPRKLSINTFCLREGIEYSNFIRWYRENKKRMREAEIEEIRVSPIHIVDSGCESSLPLSSSSVDTGILNVLSFHLKLDNGIEITKENANLSSITALLQSLSKLC
jgi:hypothetical protein